MSPKLPAADLRERANLFGFQSVGVCGAGPSQHVEFYRAWLTKGRHATMDYMARQADLREHPANLLPGARSIIAVALNYNQPNPPVDGEPRIARYALGRDYHKVLKGKLRRLAAWMDERYPGGEHRACVDSAPIFERDYANLAGLGWFGKNTCLIDSKRGSWFFIGLLLTTLDFEADEPAIGGCGNCTKCIDACPTGAIVLDDGRWQVDSRRCISYWTIEHEGPLEIDTHGWTFGCDVCQEVCPFNQPRETQPLRAQPTTEPDFLNRRGWPKLRQLAEIPYGQWDSLTAGSAVRRAGYEGLRRNSMAGCASAEQEQRNEITDELGGARTVGGRRRAGLLGPDSSPSEPS